MNIILAKKISIIDFLKKEGFSDSHRSGDNYWYLSPLHNEKTASFKVNKSGNVWYDHAKDEGGDIIRLAILLHHLSSVSAALSYIERLGLSPMENADSSSSDTDTNPKDEEPNRDGKDEKGRNGRIYEVRLSPLKTSSLISYFTCRQIDYEVCKSHCKEVHYKIRDKHYYGIAFPNVSNGHEVRNQYFKGCIGRKDVSLIVYRSNERQDGCLVFEGFMDFLSYLTLQKRGDPLFTMEQPFDLMILNSVGNIHRGMRYMEQYSAIHCYLDNDEAGQHAVQYITESLGERVTDESWRYADYKDVNDYLRKKRK